MVDLLNKVGCKTTPKADLRRGRNWPQHFFLLPLLHCSSREKRKLVDEVIDIQARNSGAEQRFIEAY